MKSYTDIEQSKKLTEMLPLESADMWWAERYAGRVEGYKYIVEEKPVYYLSFTKPSDGNCSQDKIKDIPCWSLAALLEVIRNNGRYELQMYEGGYYFEANGFMTESYFNPVDACYEIIIKLHEQKLL